MLAHVPSFGRNPRGSPDFLAYPVPKACMHVLGTRVPRRLGVARSASSPKAALALGCSLTPGLRISFGRVTCMARAASVPGLWALSFLRWLALVVGSGLRLVVGFVNPCPSWLGSWVGVFGFGLWCCPSFAGCLWCSWLGFGVGLLSGPVWFRALVPCPPPFSVPVCGVGVRAGPGSWLCPALLGWVFGVCFLRFFVFFFFFPFFRLLGLSVPGLVVYPPVSFLSGWAAGFFFLCVCLLVSVPLFPAGRCSWLGVAGFGWVVPPCLFGGPVFGALWVGGLVSFCVVGGRFAGCELFSGSS